MEFFPGTRIPKLSWAEIFPGGRDVYYEGDDPDGFTAEIKNKFGFDPAASPHKFGFGPALTPAPYWGETVNGGDTETPTVSYPFHCPAEHLNAVYGGDYPIGS